ncbi:MAG TPA: hypothetical protein VJL54_09690 [Nitrososphaera sp.]|nr:hypothetical protein [Nitrososphaera sp.]
MGRAGIIAFPVILVLGGITGYLTYDNFTKATPDPGVIESPYWKPLSASPEPVEAEKPSAPVDESQFSKVVTINILEGSVTQGNPDYEPDAAVATQDALITWVNQDSTLHTATSGTGLSDPESAMLFDSKFLGPGVEFSIPAADIGPGEHQYYCMVHPYMVSTLTIE